MKNYALFINSLAHLLVDATCAAILFSCAGDLGVLALIYNSLAFSTQCIVGLITDRLFSTSRLAAIACVAVAAARLLPLPAIAAVILAGLGNSVFHVAAGSAVLKQSDFKAAPLGIFVAPGAIGLAAGTAFPALGLIFALALLVCAPVTVYTAARTPMVLNIPPVGPKTPLFIPILLLLAVAVRAIGGSAALFPWKTGAAAALAISLFVFLGKACGGFICDRLGAEKTALFSVPAAAVCIAFLGDFAAPSLLGQALLNFTMPITLWLLYRAMPDCPGLSFGLAASALWPGTLIGGLISYTDTLRPVCIIVSFAFALAAVLISEKRLEREKIYEKPC